jgi:hypothetical protein
MSFLVRYIFIIESINSNYLFQIKLGRVLYIIGSINYIASRFEFNLLTGNHPGADVAFIHPRFDQNEAVVIHVRWWLGCRRKQGDSIQAGQQFEIQIICFPEHYQVKTFSIKIQCFLILLF